MTGPMEDAMSDDFEEIAVEMARELAAAGPEREHRIAILRRYTGEHPGLRDWFDDLVLRIAPILARQRELEQRLADLEARVEELEEMVSAPTHH